MNLKALSTKLENLQIKLVSIETGVERLDELAVEALAHQQDIETALLTMLGKKVIPSEETIEPTVSPIETVSESSELDIEDVPDELRTREQFEALGLLFQKRAEELGSEYRADEVELYCAELFKAKYDNDGLFVSDRDRQGKTSIEACMFWGELADSLTEIINLSEYDEPIIEVDETEVASDEVRADEKVQSEIDSMLNELEEDKEPNVITDDELDSLLQEIN